LTHTPDQTWYLILPQFALALVLSVLDSGNHQWRVDLIYIEIKFPGGLQVVRLLLNILGVGSQVFGKAFLDAWRQAGLSASPALCI
jgi:hypothetical protein